MSMYGEPDLAELLPAYYCSYMGRGLPQNYTSIWRGVCTHLFAMAVAIGLCIGGFYYYQLVYIPNQKENVSMEQKSTLIQIKGDPADVEFEAVKAVKPTKPSSCKNLIEDFKNQMTNVKDEIASIHSWRSTVNSLITKMQWEQDIKINTGIEEALEEYEADRLGLMDYAAAYAGGTIVQISSDTRPHPAYRPLSFFKIVNVDVLSSPEEIIRPCVLPGSCFAFRGREGAIQIRLGKPINIGGVTLGHGSRLLLGLEGMSSAPKEFEVYGFIGDFDDSGTFLGRFTYDWMGKQHQTFEVKQSLSLNQVYEIVELKILNNYGKEDFTCVYRFRVHKRDTDGSEKSTQINQPAKKKKKCC